MDIALAVGGAFLSSLLQVLFARVSTPEFLNLFRQHKFDHRILEKLKGKLRILLAVLGDAENKQTKNDAVKAWLDELQEVAYQAEDLLDLINTQINTEALRVSASPDPSTVPTNCCWCPISNFYRSPKMSTHVTTVEFLNGIVPQLEHVVQKLDDFEQQIGILGLVKGVQEPKNQAFRLPSTSLVDENDVYGRDADRDNIIEALLSDSIREKASVISIVGLGGLGKTTLAQLVYNHERLKNEFDVKAWVCISEEYDAVRITKDLLKELDISFDAYDSFNSLQTKLQQGLSMKKYFLVLDDIWNDDYNEWTALSAPFNGGKEGSKILVTTRSTKVALTIGGRHIDLELISEADCMSLFEKHALNYRDTAEISELKPIGLEIVKKCKGLPLAVKVVAGFLRSAQTTEEWNEVLRSDEWDQANNQEGILPSLRLSYNHLSSHLKRCFAYCAVFPKDYLFRKEEVILLWMANDLLEDRKGKKGLEDIGNEYFRELTFRSMFQKSKDGKFSMHDLVNDLAKFVSGKYFVRLEDQQKQSNVSSIAMQHFSYLASRYDVFEKFKSLSESKLMRTFLPLSMLEISYYWLNKLSTKLLVEILPNFKSLRTLSLRGYDIEELPNTFCNLKQLRLLDLSHTRIKKLPSWVCTFYNLQTLLLAGCQYLTEFPEDMEKLINLRHLDLRGVPLTKMPLEIGRLANLQSLSKFVVSKDSGSRIEELGKLRYLRREFTISGLENIADGKRASMAEMKSKKFIEDLTLEWAGDIANSSQEHALGDLQPHSEIKHLQIMGYCGTKFPNWLEDVSFCHMVSLSLCDIKHCSCLPAIGQLPCLEILNISSLSSIEVIGQEVYGNTVLNKPFPCLKKLTIEIMGGWREWHIPQNGGLSCLEDLYISDCPKLIGEFPKQLPCLKKLWIEKMGGWREWHIPQNGGFSCLEDLYIGDCPKLIGEFPKQLPLLRTLVISRCPGLVNDDGRLTIFQTDVNSLPQLPSLQFLDILKMSNLKELSTSDLNQLLPDLQTLSIVECHEIVSFPINLQLKKLFIFNCEKLKFESHEIVSFPSNSTCHMSIEEMDIDNCTDFFMKNLSLGSFPKLRELSIKRDSSIEEVSIPHGNQTLTSLQSLEIWSCENFMSFPVGGLPAPNLTSISLVNCPKLKSLPERMHALLPSLRIFYIINCPEIECFPEGGLPSSLEQLFIRNCKRLWSSHRAWGLHKLPSLRKFELAGIDNFEEETFPPADLLLPSTLRSLSLWEHYNLKTINFETLKHITCLQSLEIRNCPKLQSLPKEGLPASLTSLTIYRCPLLKPRLEWVKEHSEMPCIIVDDKLFP